MGFKKRIRIIRVLFLIPRKIFKGLKSHDISFFDRRAKIYVIRPSAGEAQKTIVPRL